MAPRGIEARRLEDALDKLNEEVCAEFAQLAKVPDNPDWGPKDFFYDVLFAWTAYALSDDSDMQGLLSDVNHKVVVLHRQLERLHQRLQGTARRLQSTHYDDDINLDYDDIDLDSVTLKRLPPSDVARVLNELSTLTNVLQAIPRQRRQRGRRRGIKCYPGLDVLVYQLEFHARCAGGRFTVHRKLGPKGSLIQALDRLRDCLTASPDLKHLAGLIPPHGKHPIAVYENALKAARNNTPGSDASGPPHPPVYVLSKE